MTYEAFRIGYQDSEQAARAAYQLYEAALLQRDTVKAELKRQKKREKALKLKGGEA